MRSLDIVGVQLNIHFGMIRRMRLTATRTHAGDEEAFSAGNALLISMRVYDFREINDVMTIVVVSVATCSLLRYAKTYVRNVVVYNGVEFRISTARTRAP